MIYLKGHHYLNFSVGDLSNILLPDDLKFFKIVEETGGYLPIFEMEFHTYNQDVLKYLNEGNVLQMAIGTSEGASDEVDLRISQLSTATVGTDKKGVKLAGMLDKRAYTHNPKASILVNKDGISAMKEVAGRNFTVESNIASSNDAMNWIQPHTTDMKFVKEIWKHTYLERSFPVIGITTAGSFILNDFREGFRQPARWVLNRYKGTENHIVYDPDYKINSYSGILNTLKGYGTRRLNLEGDSGVDSVASESTDPIVTSDSFFNRQDGINPRIGKPRVITENTHDKFWDAYDFNMMALANFSTVEAIVPFSRTYYPVKVLDTVSFKDNRGGIDGKKENPETSGEYMVTGVTRTYSKGSLVTILKLSRDSFDNQFGDLQ